MDKDFKTLSDVILSLGAGLGHSIPEVSFRVKYNVSDLPGETRWEVKAFLKGIKSFEEDGTAKLSYKKSWTATQPTMEACFKALTEGVMSTFRTERGSQQYRFAQIETALKEAETTLLYKSGADGSLFPSEDPDLLDPTNLFPSEDSEGADPQEEETTAIQPPVVQPASNARAAQLLRELAEEEGQVPVAPQRSSSSRAEQLLRELAAEEASAGRNLRG